MRKRYLYPFSHLFGLSQKKEAERLADSLFRFSIIRIRQEMSGTERVRTIGLHDLILDICREEARLDGSFSNAHLTLIASYRQGDKAVSEGAQLCCNSKNNLQRNFETTVQVMDTFRNWWFSVPDDSYIYRNIVRLLQDCQRPDDIIWLLNKPKWLVLQFERNGVQTVRSDISSAITSTQHSSLSEDRKTVMVRWLESVSTALTESLVQIQLVDCPGMIWTQLYGRLQNFTSKDICVTFLCEIESQAPRPWLKPNESAFNSPSTNLKESFMLDSRYLCHTEVADGITFLTVNGDQLNICHFKYGNDQLRCQAIMRFEGEDNVHLGLFNKEGFGIFYFNF